MSGIGPEGISCRSVPITCPGRTVKTFGVELETDELVDLPVDINTSVVDAKGVAVLSTARRPIFDHIETRTHTHSDGNPLVIVELDRAAGVCAGNRRRHPGHQRHGGPSSTTNNFHRLFRSTFMVTASHAPLMIPVLTASVLSPRRHRRCARHCAHPSPSPSMHLSPSTPTG